MGVAVAAGLKALLAALGIDIPAGGIVFAPRTVIIALVVGTGGHGGRRAVAGPQGG